jgi:hypothetical protein
VRWPCVDALKRKRAGSAKLALARPNSPTLRTRMDERKWVDRAKGLLMSARGIGEDEAFGLLRGAAMHANLRLGEVSRSVIEAAQWADAINRAGQLRMLSQRLVRGWRRKLLAGIDVQRRSRVLRSAVDRARASRTWITWRRSNWARRPRAGAGRSRSVANGTALGTALDARMSRLRGWPRSMRAAEALLASGRSA